MAVGGRILTVVAGGAFMLLVFIIHHSVEQMDVSSASDVELQTRLSVLQDRLDKAEAMLGLIQKQARVSLPLFCCRPKKLFPTSILFFYL